MSSFRLENNDNDNNHNSRLKSLEAKTSLLNTNPTRYSYTKFVSTLEPVLNGSRSNEYVILNILPLNGNYSPPNEAKEGSVYRLIISGRYTLPSGLSSFIINFLNSTRTYELLTTETSSAFRINILSVIKRFENNNTAIGYESSTISVSGQSGLVYSQEKSYQPTILSELQILYTSSSNNNEMTIENVIFEKIA